MPKIDNNSLTFQIIDNKYLIFNNFIQKFVLKLR